MAKHDIATLGQMRDAPVNLSQIALNYLARREYTVVELSQKLALFSTDNAAVSQLIADFQAKGWLSDERFAEQFLHTHQSKWGLLKIVHALRDKGVPKDVIERVVGDWREDDLAHIHDVWQKKFSSLPHNQVERAKQVRFLQSRGFSLDLILRFFRSDMV